jgi:lanthanide-dependent methanol dehydrogenase
VTGGGGTLCADRSSDMFRILLAIGCVPASSPFVGLRVVATQDPVAEAARSAPRDADADWPMVGKDYANTRFSSLERITVENVSSLAPSWTFVTGVERGHEAAPIVIESTMYVTTPYPNVLYALDLGNPGKVRWKHEPKPSPVAQGVACCDVVNRGCAVSGGRVFFNTLDGHVIAVDAETGEELWRTEVANVYVGETMTMAPLVVGDRVLVGNSGGEFGVRGWLKGLDAATGKVAWTAFSTGPDSDCGIGEGFRPFYEQDRGKDLGVATWGPDQWKRGGGTVWGFLSYDPELDLVFHGTANPGLWNASLRPGDNKWTCGVFARRPRTGEARWFYPWSSHDLYDHDGINENVLVELELDGVLRKVILHPERNGYVYVLDRESGQVLSATPFVRITASRSVDLETGRLIYNEDKRPQMGKVVRDIAPASPGAKDWQPSAFSPLTGLLYIPHQTLSMDYEEVEASYVAGTPYLGVDEKMYADPVDPGDGSRGALTAWDPVARRAAWKIRERFPVWSGALATGGGLVFFGTMDGWFKAADARTGDVLWQAPLPSGCVGQPVTYLGPDGKQYVAVYAGVGGWSGAVVAGNLDPRDGSAALGFANAMHDLSQHTTPGGSLHVFGLP